MDTNGTIIVPRDRLLAELCMEEWAKEVATHAGQPAELLRLNSELASQPWILEALRDSISHRSEQESGAKLPPVAAGKTIAVDLDGTLAEYNGWNGEDHFGDARPGAREAMQALHDAGHTLIIWTTRGNTESVRDWLDSNGIPFDYINENPDQPAGTSEKVVADLYIDDRAITAKDDWAGILTQARVALNGATQLSVAHPFDEAKHPRDPKGLFTHAAYQAIPIGELGTIDGYPVRRTEEHVWRMELPSGYVQGHPEEVHPHVERLKREESRARPMIAAALERAQLAPQYNPFEHPEQSEAEEKAFQALPAGALVVSLGSNTYGRMGKIVKVDDEDATGKPRIATRVRLYGVPGFASNDVEPLDREHSWRVPGRIKPASKPLKQATLFSMPVSAWRLPEPAAPPPPPLDWLGVVLGLATHTRLVGPTSSGKTTIAQVIAAHAPGQIAIIDPVWEPSTWGGLPAATQSDDGSFAPIEAAIESLLAELHRRGSMLKTGDRHFSPLWVIWDEVPNTVLELDHIKQHGRNLAGEFIRRITNYGRHVGMHLVGMGQSSTVGSWGIEGFGDTDENFCNIYLGSKAIERDRAMAGIDHPALLEWQGKLLPFSMGGMVQAGEVDAQRILATRAGDLFPLPGVVLTEQQEALFARGRQFQGQRSLFDMPEEISGGGGTAAVATPAGAPTPASSSAPGDWYHDPTEHTSNRWTNRATGEHRYQEQQPGTQRQAAAEQPEETPYKVLQDGRVSSMHSTREEADREIAKLNKQASRFGMRMGQLTVEGPPATSPTEPPVPVSAWTAPEEPQPLVKSDEPLERAGEAGDGAGVSAGQRLGDQPAPPPPEPVSASGDGTGGGPGTLPAHEGAPGTGDVRPADRPGDAAADSARTGDAGDVPGTGRGFDESLSEPPTEHNPTDLAAGNWHYPDRDFYKGGLKTKFTANIEAIRTLRNIEAEGRTTATPEEQSVLSKYTGWGQFKSIFAGSYLDLKDINEQRRAEGLEDLDPDEIEDVKEWGSEREQLQQLLSHDEWVSARRSTLNAHYTHPAIVDAHWKMAERLGFKGGRFLETSAGIGYYMGMMPRDMASQTHAAAVELDSTTGKICQLLYPSANVQVTGFQKHESPDGFYDLVASNVPFGKYKVHDPKYNQHDANIHDYFFLKSADKVRPGGLVMHITSTGTLDKPNSKIREELARTCDLVAAVRFPGGTHRENAGTDVVTDLLILRKRMPGEPAPVDGSEPKELTSGYRVGDRVIVATARSEKGNVTERGVGHVSEGPEEQRKKAAEQGYVHVDGVGWAKLADVQLVSKATAKPAWTQTVEVPDPDGGQPITVNQYFANHPEQILGRLDRTGTMYRAENVNVSMATPEEISTELGRKVEVQVDPDTKKRYFVFADSGERVPRDVLHKIGSKHFERRLEDAISRLPHGLYTHERPSGERFSRESLPAPGDVKEGGYHIDKGKLYVRDQGVLTEHPVNSKVFARIKGQLAVRDAMREVINRETANEDATEARANLNRAYDAFVAEHGFLNEKLNRQAFRADPDQPNLLALENWRDNHATKADMFRKATVGHVEKVTHAENVAEGLGVSLHESGRLDIDHIAHLTGKKRDHVEKELVEHGLAFQDPSDGWKPADQYLSGNVRRKLVMARAAAATDPRYRANVAALEKVQPEDLSYTKIDGKMGAPWIPASDMAAFAAFITDQRHDAFQIGYTPANGEWRMARTGIHSDVWSTNRVRFDDLFVSAMNRHPITVKDPVLDENGKKVGETINREATLDAQAKVNDLRELFKSWVWEDETRRDRLARHYNDNYNNIRPIHYDGGHQKFPGMNPAFKMRDIQKNFVWQVVTTGKGLAAHEVGTGKSASMIAAAMELRRLGLAKKPVIACLKANIEQVTQEAIRLYPGAKILSTVDMFTAENRKKMLSRIATGDYDLVLMTHDHLDKLPMRPEVQQKFIQEEIEEIMARRAEAEADKNQTLVRQYENMAQNLIAQLEKALDPSRKDKATYWEDTGADALFVDESHRYKALPAMSRMGNVKGISSRRSQRASNMLMRTRWMLENHGGRGVVFATGTPVTNTMGELFNIQRYLQPNELKERGIQSFDGWAATFGETQTKVEATVTGERRPTTRFSKFTNIPELQQIVGQVMDVQRADDLKNPDGSQVIVRPDRNDQAIKSPKSEAMTNLMHQLQDRARAIAQMTKQERMEKGADNMLAVCTDGRKGSIDFRLLDPDAPDDPESKTNKCVANVLELYKQKPGMTQAIFSDLGVHDVEAAKHVKVARGRAADLLGEEEDDDATPEGDEPDEEAKKIHEMKSGSGKFNLYQDIIEKLVKGGIPREQIADFSNLKGKAKEEAQDKMRRGQIRVALGSTQKLGTGVNVQNKLAALHHLDVPWLPADNEQRDGRGWRHGNEIAGVKDADGNVIYPKDADGKEYKDIGIYRYVTEGSLDEVFWQVIANKTGFIRQALSGTGDREAKEDDTESLSPEMLMAIASGDPRVLELVQVEEDVKQLKLGEDRHRREQDNFRRKVKKMEEDIPLAERDLKLVRQDIDHFQANPDFSLTIDGKTYTKRDDELKEALEKKWQEAAKQWTSAGRSSFAENVDLHDAPVIGTYRGATLRYAPGGLALFGPSDKQYGTGSSIASVDHLTRVKLKEQEDYLKSYIDLRQKDIEKLKPRIGTVFPKADELKTKAGRFAALQEQLTTRRASVPTDETYGGQSVGGGRAGFEEDDEPMPYGPGVMQFGIHAGKHISQVPPKYLQWAADNADSLTDEDRAAIREHLASLPAEEQPEKANTPAPPVAEKRKPARYISEEQREAVHAALKQLHATNTDKASQRNNVGFNQADTGYGGKLAEAEKLTDRQAEVGANILRKYKRQLGEDLHKRATTFDQAPPAPPEPHTPREKVMHKQVLQAAADAGQTVKPMMNEEGMFGYDVDGKWTNPYDVLNHLERLPAAAPKEDDEEPEGKVVPPDGWESHLAKARTYAADLGIGGKVPDWNDLDSVVGAIKEHIGSGESQPAGKPIYHGGPMVRSQYINHLQGLARWYTEQAAKVAEENGLSRPVGFDAYGISTHFQGLMGGHKDAEKNIHQAERDMQFRLDEFKKRFRPKEEVAEATETEEEPSDAEVRHLAGTTVHPKAVKVGGDTRYVHGFRPSQEFWRKWKEWKSQGVRPPKYLTLRKFGGGWTASIWGATPADVQRNADDLHKTHAITLSRADEVDLSQGAAGTWDESKHPRGQPENAGQFTASKVANNATQKARSVSLKHGMTGEVGSKLREAVFHGINRNHGEAARIHDEVAASHRAAGQPEAAASHEEAAAAHRQAEEKPEPIHRPEFLRWFGDWLHSPHGSSKVVSAQTGQPLPTEHIDGNASQVMHDGKPVVVYHGSRKAGWNEFDPRFVGNDLLYGPGFYFTEDPDIANGYQLRGAKMQLKPGVHWKEAHDHLKGKLGELRAAGKLDFTHPDKPGGRGGNGYHLVQTLLNPEKFDADEWTKAGVDVSKHFEPAEPGVVHSVYLNIRRPFNADTDHHEARKIVEQAGGNLDAFDAARHKSAYDAMAAGLGVHQQRDQYHKINSALQHAGYDGLTHQAVAPWDKDRKHRVWIAFGPKQVKSVKSKGFDPTTNRIDLSTAHAPKGGITIAGKAFTGGEFIPPADLAAASPEQVAKLEHRLEPHEKPREKKPVPEVAKEFADVTKEPTVRPSTGKVYAPNVERIKSGEVVTQAARVGVPGNWVPPPPAAIPRLPNLTKDERAVEEAFAKRFEENPDQLVADYEKGRNTVVGKKKDGSPIYAIGDAPNIFNTDDCKNLAPEWNPPGASEDEVKASRATHNTMLHQTANAIAKRAFLAHLDKLPADKKSVLVTAGGVAAGKGFALGKIDEVNKIAQEVGAVYDSAGDQASTEAPWIQKECEKRGIKVYHAYIHANPFESWASPGKGMVERATKNGRVVDAKVFTDSYVHGAKNFHAFAEQHKDNPNAEFFYIDNTKGERPERSASVPPDALQLDGNKLFDHCLRTIKEKAPTPAIRRGATVGLRIWGYEHGD